MTDHQKHAAHMRDLVLSLSREGKTPRDIAEEMTRAGYKTALGKEFTEKRVYALIHGARVKTFQAKTARHAERAAAMTTKRTRARTAYFRKPSGAGLHIEILRNGSLTANQKVAMLNAYFSRRAQGSTEV